MGEDIFFIVIGLAALVLGGEFLVRGAVGIATKAKISKLVIGMTVVAFGTSLPELIVSLQSAANGVPEIAIGNVVGSNIINISLVLGLTSLIFPIVVARDTLRHDWPMMMVVTVLLYILAKDLTLERWEGILLFLIQVGFIVYIIVKSRKEEKSRHGLSPEADIPKVKDVPVSLHLAFFFAGIIGLYFGANWLIDGSTSLAEDLGVSKRVIGITIVAFGTSVPELVTSVVAAYRKETDISIGNLLGSNVFNIATVLGLTAIVNPIPFESEVLSWDMLWVLGTAIIILPMMIISRKVGRISGLILTIGYIAYVLTLF